MSEVVFPVCLSCGNPILPDQGGVKLKCPQCNEVAIWRCQKCRKLVNSYKCPKCGFIGP
jgi:predicted RNA-binding Zn-ribbon protein involved in translation (DUF1610 family)